jgi:hypothetical protein
MTNRAKAAALGMALLASLPGRAAAQQGGGDPDDVTTIEGILEAYYEVVSRPAAVPADRARDEWIHHPDALVGYPATGPDGEPTLVTMSLGEFHDRFGGPDSEPFYEWEVHRDVHRFGNIAHVWSTYASSREPGGEPLSRGINSIQLYHDGQRWWIMSWIYDREREGNPIPPAYMVE